jgi:predicted ATPase
MDSEITKIQVRGYKSLYSKCSLDVGNLTILAGANSSGKSSIMQPLLLVKQTIEATYDPGALLLDGPNVHLTSAVQLFSKVSGRVSSDSFSVSIEVANRHYWK